MVHLVVRLVPGHVHVEHIVVVCHERQPLVIAREVEAVLLLRLEMRVTRLVLVLAVIVDAALKHDVDRTVLVQTIGEGKIQIILAVADGYEWNQIPVAGTLFRLQHILLVIIGLLIFVSQTGSIVHASDVQIILQEPGIDRLADVVEGIGRKTALGEVVVAVGKHLFRSEGKPSLPQRS